MTLVDTETGELVEPLTAMERSALTHAEASIEQGADQVATALGQIRDQRLYREDHPTFEAYCRERWGMRRREVDRKIVAAEVAEILSPIGLTSVPESQARELTDLRDDPDALRDTFQQAHEATGGKVTAAAIREVREPSGRARPRPMAEKSLNIIALYASKAARAANELTPEQIRRIRPEAAAWTVGLRESIEALERLVDSLDNQGSIK